MTMRAAKTALVFGVALFYTFVVFNNLTDYNSNYQFIRHVLVMDSTFSENRGFAHGLLFHDHRLGNCNHGSLLVGRNPAREVVAARRASVSTRKEPCNRRTDAEPADVACGVPGGRWRMVFDVAIENVERAGSGVSYVHRRRNCAVVPGAARG